ncbi:DUF397 domain-containing protein [Sphaerisporangium sp. NPDC088356]|uniref:DUF397 domain-containing protein n=1 Tax=Sphaerisporangium sp. NPDC088356 TaxID=3154871 RepID=UPI00344279EC
MDHSTFLAWRKSSYSGTGDNCVEVATVPSGGRAVRDSKNLSEPTLSFTSDEWHAFISGVKTRRFGMP